MKKFITALCFLLPALVFGMESKQNPKVSTESMNISGISEKEMGGLIKKFNAFKGNINMQISYEHNPQVQKGVILYDCQSSKCTLCWHDIKYYHIKGHQRWHQEERYPFRCTLCLVAFDKKSGLETHGATGYHKDKEELLNENSGEAEKGEELLSDINDNKLDGEVYTEKDIVNNQCKCGFKLHNSQTRAHVRWHNEKTKYTCDLCCLSYFEASCLKNHLKSATHVRQVESNKILSDN